MTCHNCRIECKRKGCDRKGHQRFQCRQCSKTFLEPREKPLEEMRLPIEKAEAVLKMLVEGSSIATIQRVTGVHHGTILKLLVLVGEKCNRIMGRYVRNVVVQDVECDEVWSFLGKKQKRVRPEDDQNLGDCYVFVAVERNSKLVLNIAMGKRDQLTTNSFIEGIRDAIRPGTSFQMTTDGFAPYKTSIPDTFGDYVDYAMLIKVYRNPSEGEARYSPPEVASTEVVPVCGNPDPKRICTSIVERSNLSIRMGTRRFTRLTNGLRSQVGKPVGCGCALVHVLQLLPDSQIAARDTCHAGRNHEPHMERARSAGGSLRRWAPLFSRPPPAGTR